MMEIESAFHYLELGIVIIALVILGILLIDERIQYAKEKRKAKKAGKKKR
jgi:quinol-cytochrome oxidoreductase complex cytochrome b subunit